MRESLTPGTKGSLCDYILTHISVVVFIHPSTSSLPPSGEPFFKIKKGLIIRLGLLRHEHYFEFAVKCSGSKMTSCIIYNYK